MPLAPPPLLLRCRPIPPITKEEGEEEKERLKAVDARPIKKVAEAKARKRRRMVAKMQQVRAAAGCDAPAELRGRTAGRLPDRGAWGGTKGGRSASGCELLGHQPPLPGPG
jgi:AdoMet-dependent rRNA methyltransferase SPB1